MTQQQQQPPRDPKAAGGKDGASPIAGKDGSPAQPRAPRVVPPAKAVAATPGPQGQGQQQVPSIVTPPHHVGGYPPSMNAAFLAAAQAQANARQQAEAGGVQGGFPGGVNIPPQFRSPQMAFHMQQVAAQQAAQQAVPGQQQMPMNPMSMNRMQQMMSQMQLDQRGCLRRCSSRPPSRPRRLRRPRRRRADPNPRGHAEDPAPDVPGHGANGRPGPLRVPQVGLSRVGSHHGGQSKAQDEGHRHHRPGDQDEVQIVSPEKKAAAAKAEAEDAKDSPSAAAEAKPRCRLCAGSRWRRSLSRSRTW